MLTSLKRTLLAGVGAIAFSHNKLKATIDELVARGELSSSQAKILLETLIRRGEEESEEISGRLLTEARSFRDLLPTTKFEFEKLAQRVRRLEDHAGLEPDESESPEGLPVEEPGDGLPPSE